MQCPGQREKENPDSEGQGCVMTFWSPFPFLPAAVCDSGKTALHAISAKPAFLSIFKSLSADAIIWKTKQSKTKQKAQTYG